MMAGDSNVVTKTKPVTVNGMLCYVRNLLMESLLICQNKPYLFI